MVFINYWKKSERFEPYVFLISKSQWAERRTDKRRIPAESESFFRERNLWVVQTLDLNTGKQYTWEEMGIKPEV